VVLTQRHLLIKSHVYDSSWTVINTRRNIDVHLNTLNLKSSEDLEGWEAGIFQDVTTMSSQELTEYVQTKLEVLRQEPGSGTLTGVILLGVRELDFSNPQRLSESDLQD
jgi:hypothetical protein